MSEHIQWECWGIGVQVAFSAKRALRSPLTRLKGKLRMEQMKGLMYESLVNVVRVTWGDWQDPGNQTEIRSCLWRPQQWHCCSCNQRNHRILREWSIVVESESFRMKRRSRKPWTSEEPMPAWTWTVATVIIRPGTQWSPDYFVSCFYLGHSFNT